MSSRDVAVLTCMVKDPPSPTKSHDHKRGASGNYVTNKIFGRLTHAIHGVVDSDPERARRDQIGKTKESLVQASSPVLLCTEIGSLTRTTA